MKTNAKIIALVFLVTSTNKSSAQFSADLFLVFPHSTFSKNGLGSGLTILSKPIDLGYKKDPDLQLRFGGSFYGSSLMKSNISDVPLEAPQIGLSTVTFQNKIHGLNAVARFSGSYSKKIIPYLDVFGGMVNFSCSMLVNPYLSNAITYSSTLQNVASINEYNYGFSGGLMFSASKRLKFNIGLTTIFSRQCGQMVDLNSAHMESGTVVLNKIDPPSKMFMVNLGIIFCFKKSDFQNGSGYRSSSHCSGSHYNHSSHHYSGGHFSGGGGGHVSVHIGSLK